MEWIFTHGAKAVVTTSQLHTRGAAAPTQVAATGPAFATPAPVIPSADPEFVVSPPISDSDTIEFEHWTEEANDGELRCNPVVYMLVVTELATARTAAHSHSKSNTLPRAVESSRAQHPLRHSLFLHSLKPPKLNPPTCVQIPMGCMNLGQMLQQRCVSTTAYTMMGFGPQWQFFDQLRLPTVTGSRSDNAPDLDDFTRAPIPRGLFRCAPMMGGFDQCALTSDFGIDDGDVRRSSPSIGLLLVY
ncbi:hypothetical protein B0H10DRAFT_2201747 [Mycena sp. CBHHK59/15]|nr:hypothetical protein B0H10DRAFT_2201747 [Mycena sp. CBHHK59/15]